MFTLAKFIRKFIFPQFEKVSWLHSAASNMGSMKNVLKALCHHELIGYYLTTVCKKQNSKLIDDPKKKTKNIWNSKEEKCMMENNW